MKTQGDGGYLQAKESNLRRSQPCGHLDLRLLHTWPVSAINKAASFLAQLLCAASCGLNQLYSAQWEPSISFLRGQKREGGTEKPQGVHSYRSSGLSPYLIQCLQKWLPPVCKEILGLGVGQGEHGC